MPSCSLTSYMTEIMEFHPVIPVLCPIKMWLNYSRVFRKASGPDFQSPGKMFAPNAQSILKWDEHLIQTFNILVLSLKNACCDWYGAMPTCNKLIA